MNKTIITMIAIIVVITGIITAVVIYNSNKGEETKNIIGKVEEENISNNTTINEVNTQNKVIQTTSEEEKISPKARITFQTKYKDCGHVSEKYIEVPSELVNKTEAELQEKYSDWNIEKFSETEIVLSKEEEGNCGEHYIARETDGFLTIYEVLEDGTEKEYEKTDISTEYLTETDKINLENGIEVNGKQNLNQFIEDFE